MGVSAGGGALIASIASV